MSEKLLTWKNYWQSNTSCQNNWNTDWIVENFLEFSKWSNFVQHRIKVHWGLLLFVHRIHNFPLNLKGFLKLFWKWITCLSDHVVHPILKLFVSTIFTEFFTRPHRLILILHPPFNKFEKRLLNSAIIFSCLVSTFIWNSIFLFLQGYLRVLSFFQNMSCYFVLFCSFGQK